MSNIVFSPIQQEEIRDCVCYLIFRAGDLYPCIGFRFDGAWRIEHAGAEDGDHQTYSFVAGDETWQPTHIWELPEMPESAS